MKQWTLTDLAENELRSLVHEGIKPTPQMILDIQCLSLEAEGNIKKSIALAKGVPYKVGGLTLHPLTIAGSSFFAEFCDYFDNELLQSYAYIFALAFGQNASKMELREESAREAVVEMASKMTCTIKDIEEAIEFYSDDKPNINLSNHNTDDNEDGKAWLADLSSTVVAFTGLDPDIVEYQMSIEYVVRLIDDYIRSIGGGKDDNGLLGLRKLAAYVDEVRTKHKMKVSNNG